MVILTICELGPCGYVWILLDMLYIYGYLWIYVGLHISDLLYWIRYPLLISMHIHAYPCISIEDLHKYPHVISKNYISALSTLLSIKVSIHIHSPLGVSMYIQARSPSQIYINIHTAYAFPYSYLLYPYISINIHNQSKQISMYYHDIHRYHKPAARPLLRTKLARFPYIFLGHQIFSIHPKP